MTFQENDEQEGEGHPGSMSTPEGDDPPEVAAPQPIFSYPPSVADSALESEAERVSDWWGRLSTVVVFLAVYAVLLVLYRPDLLLSATTTSGGDMGAHHYPAKFMIEELLPHLRLTGWTSQWYAGMPIFTFYLPLPFLLIAIFDVFIPYTVAFKLVTVLGVFLLPVAAYAFGRAFRLRPPFPQLAPAFALAFLLMSSFSIYGGNILSTLAGEFGYSLSFALVFIFLGTLNRGLERGRFDWLFTVNALILAALVLSHPVTTIMTVIIAPSLLVLHRRWRAVAYIWAVFLLGFCLTAFWGLPFVEKLSWTARVQWTPLQNLRDLLPLELRPFAALGILGMAYAVARRDIRTIPLFWMTIVGAILFFILPTGRLWNGRIVPFFYLSIDLWAAYGVAWLLRPFTVMMKDLLGLREGVARRLYPALLAVILVMAVGLTAKTAASWIKWNYSGYEAKASWPQYKAINDFLAKLPRGRVMWEHSPKLDKFGTPRIFELIPYWTPQPTMEGTLMESAFTAPYHFINQAELSLEPSHAIIGVDYPPRNAANGITHLQFMNVSYFIAVSPEVSKEVEADPRADLLAKIDMVSIFRISGTGGYVEVARNLPVRVKTSDWRSTIVPWYKNLTSLDVPVIWDRGEPGLKQFREVRPSEVISLPAEPINVQGRVLSEQVDIDTITFETTAIGQPHWIKVSYFPNWKVKGADGPYVVSPSFMMVIPREREVTLYYGRTLTNNLGQGLGVLGLVVLGAAVVGEVRRRKGMAPVADADADDDGPPPAPPTVS